MPQPGALNVSHGQAAGRKNEQHTGGGQDCQADIPKPGQHAGVGEPSEAEIPHGGNQTAVAGIAHPLLGPGETRPVRFELSEESTYAAHSCPPTIRSFGLTRKTSTFRTPVPLKSTVPTNQPTTQSAAAAPLVKPFATTTVAAPRAVDSGSRQCRRRIGPRRRKTLRRERPTGKNAQPFMGKIVI